ncbi:hypothetical protein [Paraburkholderia sp. Ac-20347]|uniref:hypothetical protein n=1 Tax=Paraburkholderia sp. Ac-20347 TaxID=2703892 RepID=UPI001981DAEA|nr:hypothetical protein [Paraburkholderia sp. Ac-20347]MBN3813434.1 hypothetical protein [Paraburkholderia sp. Ac-20347]
MNEPIDKAVRANTSAAVSWRRGGVWSVLAVGAALIAMALAAIAGGCIAYCDGTWALFWAVFMPPVIVFQAFAEWPVASPFILVACVAGVAAIAKWSPIRPGIGVALAGIVLSAGASWIVTGLMTDFAHTSCGLM